MFGFFWFFFKIAGLAPWKNSKTGAFRYSWWSLLTGYGLLLGAIVNYTYSNFDEFQTPGMYRQWISSPTAVVVEYISLGTTTIACFMCLVAATIQTKKIFHIVVKFQDLNSYRKIPNDPFRYRHAILLGLLMTSLVISGLAIRGPAQCVSLLGVWYLRFFLYGSEFMFTSLVLTLYKLFQNVNSQLRLNLQFESTDTRHSLQVLPFVDYTKGYGPTGNRVPLNRRPEGLRELSAIHWQLCTIGKEINAAFNGQLLTMFVTCTAHVVIIPYFVFLMLDIRFDVRTVAVVANIGWVTVHVLQLCLLVWPCSLASDEARKTSTIIVHSLNKPLPADFRHQMEMFLVQLTNHELNFNVYDMFTIDLTVLTSVAGAVTTYLVILIQFQNSPPPTE